MIVPNGVLQIKSNYNNNIIYYHWKREKNCCIQNKIIISKLMLKLIIRSMIKKKMKKLIAIKIFQILKKMKVINKFKITNQTKIVRIMLIWITKKVNLILRNLILICLKSKHRIWKKRKKYLWVQREETKMKRQVKMRNWITRMSYPCSCRIKKVLKISNLFKKIRKEQCQFQTYNLTLIIKIN